MSSLQERVYATARRNSSNYGPSIQHAIDDLELLVDGD